MGPSSKSSSFVFHKNIFGDKQNSRQNCRRKLQDRFEEMGSTTPISDTNQSGRSNRSVMSLISISKTRRVLRVSADKVSQTFSDLRTTFGNFTQKFKMSTKRREILEEGPVTPVCATPHTVSRQVLGRTPTKLYSPFSIESPYNKPLTNNRFS